MNNQVNEHCYWDCIIVIRVPPQLRFRISEEAYRKGNVIAMTELAKFYFYTDKDRSIDLLRRAIDLGDKKAIMLLITAYDTDTDTDTNTSGCQSVIELCQKLIDIDRTDANQIYAYRKMGENVSKNGTIFTSTQNVSIGHGER